MGSCASLIPFPAPLSAECFLLPHILLRSLPMHSWSVVEREGGRGWAVGWQEGRGVLLEATAATYAYVW